MILFLLILVGSFYVYSGSWLESREQKICAVLFLLSMPQYFDHHYELRPQVFLFFLSCSSRSISCLKNRLTGNYSRLPWYPYLSSSSAMPEHLCFFSVFVMVFFLLYCLFWGKFSKPLYITIISTLSHLCYLTCRGSLISQINMQYTSTEIFITRKFYSETHSILHCQGIWCVFFMIICWLNYQFVYVVILAAILFTVGRILIYIHRKTILFLSQSNTFPAFILPIQNLSHSTAACSLWLGPVHVIFSVFGFFHLDNKGKCFFFTALLTTLSTGPASGMRKEFL